MTDQPYPLKKDSLAAGLPDSAPYLTPQLGIESEAPGIKNKALELTWQNESAWECGAQDQ